MSDLGSRIKDRRTELKWTLAKLSQESGLSGGFLSDLENGNRKSPNADSISAISNALGISTDYLISGSKRPADPGGDQNIPASLAKFAHAEGLSFSHTLVLLQMRKQIMAFRSATKSEDLDEFDWKAFYESVKKHLK